MVSAPCKAGITGLFGIQIIRKLAVTWMNVIDDQLIMFQLQDRIVGLPLLYILEEHFTEMNIYFWTIFVPQIAFLFYF